MRLFIAIELPESLKDQLAHLRTTIDGATWTRRDTYHLTLRFLGDGIPENRVPELHAALSEIQSPAFDVKLAGVGRFPPKGAARVLWVGINPTPELIDLYHAIERAVTTIGFLPDDHPFSAHITLARLKQPKPDPAVAAFLTAHAAFDATPVHADSFKLISSTLTSQGAQYTILDRFPLGGKITPL